MSDTVTAVWARPFALDEPQIENFRKGCTLLDIADNFSALPPAFKERGIICINGEEIYPELWGQVRPHASTPERPCIITFHCPLAGGEAVEVGVSRSSALSPPLR